MVSDDATKMEGAIRGLLIERSDGFPSGFFGLAFGALCTPAQVIFFNHVKTLEAGLKAGFAWWIAGIPYDVVHGIGNFTIMLVLYRPIRIAINKLGSAPPKD